MDTIPTFEEQRQPMGTRDTPVISVVDDDESLRRSLGNFLRSVGFRVETFASAEDFLRSARREGTGCLLLDLQMDRNALADIESLARRVRVMVVTASEQPADALAAIRAGARAVVFKRFALRPSS